MPLTPALTLPDLLSQLRNDLMDPPSATPRWSDPVLMRCVDRSVETYSRVSPFLQTSQIASIAGSRLYPAPDGCWRGRWPRRLCKCQSRECAR